MYSEFSFRNTHLNSSTSIKSKFENFATCKVVRSLQFEPIIFELLHSEQHGICERYNQVCVGYPALRDHSCTCRACVCGGVPRAHNDTNCGLFFRFRIPKTWRRAGGPSAPIGGERTGSYRDYCSPYGYPLGLPVWPILEGFWRTLCSRFVSGLLAPLAIHLL